MKQIPLPISPESRMGFDNFVVGDNQTLFQSLRAMVQSASPEQQILFWSRGAHGKTHLLHAVCSAAGRKDKQVAYVPLKDVRDASAEILADLQFLDLVCVDDIDVVVSRGEWASALFALINACRDRDARLVMTSRTHPQKLTLPFEDLRSRLMWGAVYRLRSLSDQQLRSSMIQRAKDRGIQLDNEVANYLLTRTERSAAAVLGLIDQLDHESLVQQRKITIPLVREILREI